MSFHARVLKVLIASPRDTSREREAVERALHDWNISRAYREKMVLVPWRWEEHGVSELGPSAQSVIDLQALDECDIVIAVFNAHLGTATEDAVSGTAHEIFRAHDQGKPVHIFFSDAPLPRDIDTRELDRLRAFQRDLQSKSLLGSYDDISKLQTKVRDAIERDLAKFDELHDSDATTGDNGARSPYVYELVEIHHKYRVSAERPQYMDLEYAGRRILRNVEPNGRQRHALIWTKSSDKLPPFDPENPPRIDLASYERTVSGSAHIEYPPRKCMGPAFTLDLTMDPPLRTNEAIDFRMRGLFPNYRLVTAADMRDATRRTPMGQRDFDYASFTVNPPIRSLKMTVDLPVEAGMKILGPRSTLEGDDFPATEGPVATFNEEYEYSEVVDASGVRYQRMRLNVRDAVRTCRYRLAWRLP